MMSRLSERDQRALRFGLIGGVVVLLLVFVGFPAMEYWDGLQRKLDTARAKLASAQRDLDDAADVRQTSTKLARKATIHPTSRTLNQQTARMLQQIGSFAAYSRLSVRRLEGLQMRDEEDYYRSGLSFQFAASLDDLHSFLSDVESAEPTLKVERLSLTTDPKDPSRVQGQMVVTGYAVVLKKEAKA